MFGVDHLSHFVPHTHIIPVISVVLGKQRPKATVHSAARTLSLVLCSQLAFCHRRSDFTLTGGESETRKEMAESRLATQDYVITVEPDGHLQDVRIVIVNGISLRSEVQRRCGRGSCYGVELNGYFLEHSRSKDRF